MVLTKPDVLVLKEKDLFRNFILKKIRRTHPSYPTRHRSFLKLWGSVSVSSYHVTYEFYSESTHCSCLNVKELLARNRRDIWSLSDCNRIRPHHHLVRKRALNYIVKLAFFEITELCCEYLSVWCIWLCVINMSHTRFRVNLHSVIVWMSKSSLLETFVISEV